MRHLTHTVKSCPAPGPLHCPVRDGNPNVTHDTTRDVCVLARLEAVNYYFKAVERLMFDLSIWRCTPELKVRARHVEVVLHVW